MKTNECLDVDLEQLNKKVLASRQFGVTGPFDEPDHQTKLDIIKDYLVYKMPLGVWVALYVVIALLVVSLLT